MNPGTDCSEEQVVWFKETSDQKSTAPRNKITLGKAVHPHFSNGVYLENHDGSVETFASSKNPKSTYSYQLEMCQDHLIKMNESNGSF